MRRVVSCVALTCAAAIGGGRLPAADAQSAPAPPTFARDVAPILYANCVTCHRPGQVAPFSLLTYDDARTHVDEIVRMTRARRMPPWLAAPGVHRFVGERRLDDTQIATLAAWAAAGAPEGPRGSTPPVPRFPDGWQLGEPDLTLRLPKPLVLRPGHHDRYRQLVYPVALPEGRYIRAVEFRVGSAPVHHAVIRVDRTHGSRRRDGADGSPGFEGVMAPDVRNPDGHFVGWAPGRGPIVSAPGLPWRLDRGADLVIEVHLIPGAAPIDVQPVVGLFFTDEKPAQTPVELMLGVKALDIPAGTRDYTVADEFTFPFPVTLLSLYPHAHYLASEMIVTARDPDGRTTTLLHIPRWDFHWQQEYRFTRPVALAPGTTLAMRYRYDNSDANPHNPSSPPRRVLYGMQSSDEMANLGIQILPASYAEGRRLARAFLERDRQASIAGAELRTRIEPESAAHWIALGKGYVEAERIADAIPALEQALRLNPASPAAHDYFGRALFAAGRPGPAVDHLRRAVDLAPDDEIMHLDLAKALADTGELTAALDALRRALAINPDYAQAHENVGIVYVRMGRHQDAVASFTRAIQSAPESASAENGLGVALAQLGRIAEAIQHFRRAVTLDPDDVSARDNLARAEKGR